MTKLIKAVECCEQYVETRPQITSQPESSM